MPAADKSPDDLTVICPTTGRRVYTMVSSSVSASITMTDSAFQCEACGEMHDLDVSKAQRGWA
jgi:hypothetical protein